MSNEPMILAIDPGPEQSAWVLFPLCNRKPHAFAKVANRGLLDWLIDDDWSKYTIVIEQVESYGMPVGFEVFETVFWSGRFAQAVPNWWRISRKDVKMHLCHKIAGVNDAVIRQRLIDLYGGKERAIGKKKSPGPLYGVKKDIWAALALAYVAAEKMKAGANA